MKHPELDWSFAIIADPQIGAGINDYGDPGYDDDPNSGEEYWVTEDFRRSVKMINDSIEKYDIRFTLVLGDLTDSAEKSEFGKAKQILDELLVPYVPLFGNHDHWPYARNSKGKHDPKLEAPYGYGDVYFKEIFDGTFSKLKKTMPNWDDWTRSIPIYNGEVGHVSYFQNFAFDYGDYHFVCLDFTGRGIKGLMRVKRYPGGPGQGDLFDSKKCRGTFAWLKEHFEKIPVDKKIIITAHHPLCSESWYLIAGDIGWFGFSHFELSELKNFFRSNPRRVACWFAGHVHRNAEYEARLGLMRRKSLFPVVETAAPFALVTRLVESPWSYLPRYDPQGFMRIVKVKSDGLDYKTTFEGRLWKKV